MPHAICGREAVRCVHSRLISDRCCVACTAFTVPGGAVCYSQEEFLLGIYASFALRSCMFSFKEEHLAIAHLSFVRIPYIPSLSEHMVIPISEAAAQTAPRSGSSDSRALARLHLTITSILLLPLAGYACMSGIRQ